MKKLLLISTLILSNSLIAAPNIPASEQLGPLEITEVSSAEYKALNGPGLNGGLDGGFAGGEEPSKPTVGDRVETTGKVIQAARDMVALGEAIYELVKKGRPTNITEYAPISVVPRDPETKEHVDPFELEGFSIPVEKNFTAKIKNGAGKEVVSFTYRVIYSYGGSFNGTGKYLTGVNIIPGSVKTSYGWDFNASMKLSGIMNHGSKLDPVAGVMITVKYQMNSWSNAFERNDTMHITGRGELKSYVVQ